MCSGGGMCVVVVRSGGGGLASECDNSDVGVGLWLFLWISDLCYRSFVLIFLLLVSLRPALTIALAGSLGLN